MYSFKEFQTNLNFVFRVLIFLLFSALYLPHCFIIIEDLGLILAYEVDAGSIIASIQDLINNYNMNKSYHSRYYGWSYLSLNYAIIKLAIFLSDGYILEHKFYFYFLVRFILFLLGLISAMVLFEVALRFFKSGILALIASVLYIFNFIYSGYFYIIHPEVAGVLFLLLAVFYLEKIDENINNHKKYYFITLVFLVLASLAKQIFFIISLPILLSVIYKIYFFRKEKNFKEFLSSEFFKKILINTFIISLAILLIIHPYFLFNLSKTIKYQIEIKEYFTESGLSLSFFEALSSWVKLIGNNLLFLFFIFTTPLVIFISFIEFKRRQNFNYLLVFINAIALLLVTSLVFCVNRVYIYSGYLYPLSPFIILYLVSMVYFVKNRPSSSFCLKILYFCLYVILLYSCYIAIKASIKLSSERYDFRDTTPYLTYNYIIENSKNGEKFAYDHFVAFPSEFSDRGCHYWQGCGTDYVEEFKPDYVMFNDEFKINGKPLVEKERLKKYIADHNMKLDGFIKSNKQNLKISIYKKK